MKAKIFILLLITTLLSCRTDDNEVQLSHNERVVRALSEIMDVYALGEIREINYEEIVDRIKLISKKYGIEIQPISEGDFYGSFNKNNNSKAPNDMRCSGSFTKEIVSESDTPAYTEGHCWGSVWHYANGSTGFTRTCYEGGKFKTSAFECFGPAGTNPQ